MFARNEEGLKKLCKINGPSSTIIMHVHLDHQLVYLTVL